MATNKVQEGKILQLAVAATKTSGQPVRVGRICGVAIEAISAAGTGSVDISGVYDLTVSAAAAVKVGDPLYLATAGVNVHATTTSGTLFGWALEAIATAASTVVINVLLAGGSPKAV